MLKIAKKQGRGNKFLDEGNQKQKLKGFNQKIRLISIVLALFLLSFSYPSNLKSEDTPNDKIWYEWTVPTQDHIHKLESDLIMEVEKYILKNSFGASKMKSQNLISECLDHNFDLILALSQAQVESHFGTRGIASRTNSVFNVGTFDNGIILYRYGHPDLSVRPYISLVKRRYMIDGRKTTHDLLRPNSFVNYKGARYASLSSYENRVKGVYDLILEKTPIDSLWKEYTSVDYIYAKNLYSSIDTFYKIINNS